MLNNLLIEQIEAVEELLQMTIKNGGFTHHSQKGRYVVATENLGFYAKDKLTTVALIKILAGKFPELTRLPIENIGTWLDSKTGLVHIDLILSLNTLDRALHIARKNNELAIYDTKLQKEIRL